MKNGIWKRIAAVLVITVLPLTGCASEPTGSSALPESENNTLVSADELVRSSEREIDRVAWYDEAQWRLLWEDYALQDTTKHEYLSPDGSAKFVEVSGLAKDGYYETQLIFWKRPAGRYWQIFNSAIPDSLEWRPSFF